MIRSRLAALALLAAVALPTRAVPDSAPNGTPIEIHAIASVTGFAAFMATGEQQVLNAAEAAINKSGGINGHPVKLILHDDGSQPAQDVQLVNQLIAQHVPAIIGPGLVASCGAMAPLLVNGPVDLCFSTGIHPDPGSYQYSMGVPSSEQIVAALHYLRSRGWTRYAVITPNDATGQDADRVIDAAFALPENKGLTIAQRQHFTPSDTSVDAQIARIQSSDAQVLIAWASGSPFGTILHSVQNEGLTMPVLGSPGDVTYSAMSAYGPFMPRDTFFVTYPAVVPPDNIQNPGVRRAVVAMRAAFGSYGIVPDISAIPWDAAQIIAAAYRKYGPGLTAAQMRDYMNSTKFVGAFGSFDFQAYPQRGLGTDTALVVRFDRDRHAFVAVSKMGGDPL